jgi:predicted peptidase
VFAVLIWGTFIIPVALRAAFDTMIYSVGTTFKVQTDQPGCYPYLLRLPPGYTDFGSSRPLIVYLHGAGETNVGLDVLQERDLWACAKGHVTPNDFPFIMVSPVTPKHGWEPGMVKRFVEQIINDPFSRYRIDPNRVYLTGVSMGGFGTFHVACAFPETFAAIAPVCGGGEPNQAEKLKDVPTWAFHGDADDVVAYECTADMIEAIKKTGGTEVKFTTFEGAGHGIAGEVYQNPELYRWMLTHQKGR